jgi:hypothetical protein
MNGLLILALICIPGAVETNAPVSPRSGTLQCRTPEELRTAANPHLVRLPPIRKPPRDYDPDTERQFLVPYLGAAEPGLRDTAAEIMARLMYYGRHIRASLFDEFLSNTCPTNVRIVALGHSLACHGYAELEGVCEEKRVRWTEMLNEIADTPGSVPYISVVMLGMRYGTVREKCFTALTPDKNRLLLRHFLKGLDFNRNAKLDKDSAGIVVQEMLYVVWSFPRVLLFDEARAWYPQASADARHAFAGFYPWGMGDRELRAAFGSLSDLFLKDPEERIRLEFQKWLEALRRQEEAERRMQEAWKKPIPKQVTP